LDLVAAPVDVADNPASTAECHTISRHVRDVGNIDDERRFIAGTERAEIQRGPAAGEERSRAIEGEHHRRDTVHRNTLRRVPNQPGHRQHRSLTLMAHRHQLERRRCVCCGSERVMTRRRRGCCRVVGYARPDDRPNNDRHHHRADNGRLNGRTSPKPFCSPVEHRSYGNLGFRCFGF
jgi:hypothetical protein